MTEKLGIALQWVLIKLWVLKSDGAKCKDGTYMVWGLYKKNPLSWVVLLIIAVPVLGYGIVMAIKQSCDELWSALMED